MGIIERVNNYKKYMDPNKMINRNKALVLIAVLVVVLFLAGYLLENYLSGAYTRSYYDKRIENLKEVLEKQPESNNVRAEIGLSQYLNGNIEKSINTLKDILDEDPGNEFAALYLGLILSEQKDYNKAISLLDRYVNQHRGAESRLAYLYLGQDYLAVGKPESALQNLKMTVQRDPANPVVYYSLGQTYEKLKDKKNAIDAYKSALKISSNYVEADLALKNLISGSKGNSASQISNPVSPPKQTKTAWYYYLVIIIITVALLTAYLYYRVRTNNRSFDSQKQFVDETDAEQVNVAEPVIKTAEPVEAAVVEAAEPVDAAVVEAAEPVDAAASRTEGVPACQDYHHKYKEDLLNSYIILGFDAKIRGNLLLAARCFASAIQLSPAPDLEIGLVYDICAMLNGMGREREAEEYLLQFKKKLSGEQPEQAAMMIGPLDETTEEGIDEVFVDVNDVALLEAAVSGEDVDHQYARYHKDLIDSYIILGFDAKAKGKLYLAVKYFSCALELDPPPDLEMGLVFDVCTMLKDIGQYQKAEECLRQFETKRAST